MSMGNTDLVRMKAGLMDRNGEGMTTAGKACAMVGVALGLIIFIIGIGYYLSNLK